MKNYFTVISNFNRNYDLFKIKYDALNFEGLYKKYDSKEMQNKLNNLRIFNDLIDKRYNTKYKNIEIEIAETVHFNFDYYLEFMNNL